MLTRAGLSILILTAPETYGSGAASSVSAGIRLRYIFSPCARPICGILSRKLYDR